MEQEKFKKRMFYLVNGLTVLRIILALLTMGLIFSGYRLAAFFTFLLGILTDLMDGDLARRHHVVSEFGKILDPIADLSLMYSVIIPLFILGEFSIFVEGAVIFASLAVIAAVLEHSIKNKKLTILCRRRPSSVINSYFVFTYLTLCIIDSPYKHPMAYLTLFILAITAFDYFVNNQEK